MTEMQSPETNQPPSDGRNTKDHETLRLVAKILVIAVIVIVVLVFWRGCEADSQDDRVGAGDPVVLPVETLDEMDGAVAVWLKPDTSITEVLERNDLSEARFMPFGEGTFVIGTEGLNDKDIVRRLEGDPGVYDAGFVYLEAQP